MSASQKDAKAKLAKNDTEQKVQMHLFRCGEVNAHDEGFTLAGACDLAGEYCPYCI